MVVNLLSSKASAQKNTVTGFLDICRNCLMSLESQYKKQTFFVKCDDGDRDIESKKLNFAK